MRGTGSKPVSMTLALLSFFTVGTGAVDSAEPPGWRLPAKPGQAWTEGGDPEKRGPVYPLEPFSDLLVQRARQGSAEAEYNLGRCYQNGAGVPADPAEAVRWYRKAARQGHAWAQSNLGWCYYRGLGVPPDIDEAIYWYRCALEEGDAGAQFHLGEFFFQGTGVRRDLEEAVRLWKMSARQGYEAAIDACRHHGIVISSN